MNKGDVTHTDFTGWHSFHQMTMIKKQSLFNIIDDKTHPLLNFFNKRLSYYKPDKVYLTNIAMKYLALILFAFLTVRPAAQAQQKTEQITVDGLPRNFVTYIPSTENKTGKLPFIISLHGRLGNGKGMMNFADFRSLAEKDKFIIVCPDGIDRSWNDGRNTPANKKGIDDVKFIDQLITYIIDTYHGDPKRVYVTGMSNGGFMASRLACELSNRIAAVAVVAASMDGSMSYHPVRPIPIMYIQGTKDPLVPFNGGAMKGAGGEIYGHEELLTLWANADRCEKNPLITNLPGNAGDGTKIIKEEYVNKATNIKVIGYTITNGGHTWPGGTQYMPKFLVGTVTHNLNACDIIWDFFKAYRVVK
jgi:polyhydroxybutyrate depolymerase